MAELNSVGQRGEQSLRRVDNASREATRGLNSLSEQAGMLGSRIRAPGGILAGITAGGGLAMLIDRSITAADATGKVADKIGVNVEALQALRYAAESAGVSQNTLDMALQRFTRRVAEAASGSDPSPGASARGRSRFVPSRESAPCLDRDCETQTDALKTDSVPSQPLPEQGEASKALARVSSLPATSTVLTSTTRPFFRVFLTVA
ncbi:MAG: hypothetical protein H7829_11640 [Magnetococcus sp. THC-1_WYH]